MSQKQYKDQLIHVFKIYWIHLSAKPILVVISFKFVTFYTPTNMSNFKQQ